MRQSLRNVSGNIAICGLLVLTLFMLAILAGCRTSAQYRLQADKTAAEIIAQKQKEALGRSDNFTIERPSDTLRRTLMIDQDLPHSSQASLGTADLKKIEYWPEDNYPPAPATRGPNDVAGPNSPISLSLVDALQVAAFNNSGYQAAKESIFKEALSLDLTRNQFRNIFFGQLKSQTASDTTGDRANSSITNSAQADVTRTLKNGADLNAALAVDLANLLTLGGASSLGIGADASVSIPLLRGSARHIVTEPLTLAERSVVYAVWNFEQFKAQFVVSIADGYFGVLRQLDSLKNSEENYRSLVLSARRSRRLADAGRLTQVEVDQAVQNELRAYTGWISATESYKQSLDSFKVLLGLPPDAAVQLDPNELARLTAPSAKLIDELTQQNISQVQKDTPSSDAPVQLVKPSREKAGPLEIEQPRAVRLALDNRLDLKATVERVYDAQRAVVVAADALRAELTLFGSAASGGGGDAAADDITPRFDKISLSALMTLDLPIERTKERNEYRNTLITLDSAVRDVQKLEDGIKLAVMNDLRSLFEARENLFIQAQAVRLAQKRVKSVNLFLEAGRAQMRDLLEAQESLLGAQNGLTSAVVNYRVTELELQRDMGLLKVDENGLWKEYSPEMITNVKK